MSDVAGMIDLCDDNPKKSKARKYEYEIRIHASPLQTHQGRG